MLDFGYGKTAKGEMAWILFDIASCSVIHSRIARPKKAVSLLLAILDGIHWRT